MFKDVSELYNRNNLSQDLQEHFVVLYNVPRDVYIRGYSLQRPLWERKPGHNSKSPVNRELVLKCLAHLYSGLQCSNKKKEESYKYS